MGTENPYEAPRGQPREPDGGLTYAPSLKEAGADRVVYVDARGRVRGRGYRLFATALVVALAAALVALLLVGFSRFHLLPLSWLFVAVLIAVPIALASLSIPAGRIRRGLALIQAERYEEAEELLDRVLASRILHPSQKPFALLNRAVAVWRQGRLEEALETVREVKRTWVPASRLPATMARYNEATLLVELGRPGEALALLSALPAPVGDYFIVQHWTIDARLWFAGPLAQPSVAVLEERARALGRFGESGTTLRLLLAWALVQCNEDARADELLRAFSPSPLIARLIARHVPGVWDWYRERVTRE